MPYYNEFKQCMLIVSRDVKQFCVSIISRGVSPLTVFYFEAYATYAHTIRLNLWCTQLNFRFLRDPLKPPVC